MTRKEDKPTCQPVRVAYVLADLCEIFGVGEPALAKLAGVKPADLADLKTYGRRAPATLAALDGLIGRSVAALLECRTAMAPEIAAQAKLHARREAWAAERKAKADADLIRRYGGGDENFFADGSPRRRRRHTVRAPG